MKYQQLIDKKRQPLHVLVVGNDDSILDFSSPLFRKVSYYKDTIGRLTVICRTRKVISKIPILQGQLTIYAVYARNPIIFVLRTFFLGSSIIKKESPGIVTADNPFEEGLAAWLLARFSRLPFHLQVHTDIMSPFFRRASWKEYVRYILARHLVLCADCIRVVSDRTRLSLVKLGILDQFLGKAKRNSKIVVLPIWTDVSKFLEARPHQLTKERFRNYTFKIVTVGRFVDKEKNFSMLIEAMRDFIKVCPRALLVLVGDGPDKSNYQLQVARYGLQNNVVIEGILFDTLPAFLKSFDVFVLSSNYEGWGRVIIEAMASGLPVIMTDVGLAGEVVKDGKNGIVVPVGDKKKIVSALEELAQDVKKRERLRNAAIKTVLGLSPKTREEYNLLYKESFFGCI